MLLLQLAVFNLSRIYIKNGWGNVESYLKLQMKSCIFFLFFTNIDRGQGVRRWCLLMFVVQSFTETWTFLDPGTRILCDKRTYDLLVTCLNDFKHIWASKTTAKLWQQVDRWTKATSRHQPRQVLGRPHICDGWHRLDEALLCILPCAQNFRCA